jgi:hypothetical protein
MDMAVQWERAKGNVEDNVIEAVAMSQKSWKLKVAVS